MAWRGICTVPGAWTIRGFSMFSVIEKSTGRWVGRLGPWQPEDWPGTEVGWGLAREVWGKGYATEGAAACHGLCLRRAGLERGDPHHRSGQSGLPGGGQAPGLDPAGAGVLPAPYGHMQVETWGQTREQWRARRKKAGRRCRLQSRPTFAGSPSARHRGGA